MGVSPKNKNLANGFIKPFTRLEAGDPYGNWTHDYAVKGRRLNLLTNGPKTEDFSSEYVVAATGFEPVTPWVWTKCSSQLSYAAVQR